MKTYITWLGIAFSLCFCTANVGCGGVRNISKSPDAAALVLTPQNLAFGTVAVGGSSKKTITVSNQGKTTLVLGKATIGGSSMFRVNGLTLPLSLAPSQSRTFEVVFSPASAGATTSNLSLSQTSTGSAAVVSLQGLGATTSAGGPTSGGPSSASALNISGNISPASAGTGASLTVTGAANNSATANASGNFVLSGLSAGSYTVTPSKAGVTFSPSSRVVTLASSDVTGVNFSSIQSVTHQASGPIVIDGQSGRIINGLKITSTTGDCVQITNSTDIIIQNSEIGPCAGNAVVITGGRGISIFDSYIHPETLSPGCCDHNDGIFATGTQDLLIQGNVIAYGEANIEVVGGTSVNVLGNLLLNPRGPFPRAVNFQCWSGCSNVTVENNYALSSRDTSKYKYPEATTDSINFGYTTTFVAKNNFITGGHSTSGCGLLADQGAKGGQFRGNRLLDTGGCGLGISSGTNHIIDGNKLYTRNPVAGGGNTALYVWKQYPDACGPVTVSNNISDEIKSDGFHSGWWNGGGCEPVTLSNNTFNQPAGAMLSPTATVFAPPLIPPQPKNCVVISPYSTQTSKARCP